MRVFYRIFVCVCFSTQAQHAGELTADACMAPDNKHHIVLRQGDVDTGGNVLAIRDTSTQKDVYSRPAGYAALKVWPDYLKCLWSPDSKFVAIFERGSKTWGETKIYFVNGDAVQEVAFPDVMPRIRPHLTAEVRGIWIRPEVWLPEHGLIFSVVGFQSGEDEEHGNFRFILTLRLHANKAGKLVAEVASFQQDRSIPFSVR